MVLSLCAAKQRSQGRGLTASRHSRGYRRRTLPIDWPPGLDRGRSTRASSNQKRDVAPVAVCLICQITCLITTGGRGL